MPVRARTLTAGDQRSVPALPPRSWEGVSGRRAALLTRLVGASELVVVAAPAGYGKTQLVRQWEAAEERSFVWARLDQRANAPAVLLDMIEIALQGAFAGSAQRPVPVVPSARPASAHDVGRLMADCGGPFVLVLDDLHLVEDRSALHVLGLVLDQLPVGSTATLVGSSRPDLRLGRLRLQMGVIEVATADLALDVHDAIRAFAAVGARPDPGATADLLDSMEGWPAGIQFAAAVAAGDGGLWGGRLEADGAGALARAAWLSGLDEDDRAFLRRTSCLEALSGPLCDAVLGVRGSARRLEDLERRVLLVPLEHRPRWFRAHRLLRRALSAELREQEPGLQDALLARASRWFEQDGDLDAAVTAAVDGADLDRAEALVVGTAGRWRMRPTSVVVQSFLASLPPERLVSSPLLGATMAQTRLAVGDGAGARHWLARAEDAAAATVAADREPAEVTLALLRATIGRLPAGDMLDEATYAHARLPYGDEHAASCLLRGVALLMLGELEAAEEALLEGRAEAAGVNPVIEALCSAYHGALLATRGAWPQATATICEAWSLVEDHEPLPPPMAAVLSGLHCLVAARAGRIAEAEAARDRARGALAHCAGVAPWANLEARLALAGASLALGQRARARALVAEAEQVLAGIPDAARAKQQLADLRDALLRLPGAGTWAPAALTAAELRVLHFLPTHLTLAEIAQNLLVSRNTVKSQVISIYRKLGTASRAEAVTVARDAALLTGELSGASSGRSSPSPAEVAGALLPGRDVPAARRRPSVEPSTSGAGAGCRR